MGKLSYTQEYFLCAVNTKGELKTDAIHSALFAGALLELHENGFLEYTGNEKELVVVSKPLDNDFAYLKPLYDYIESQKKPMKRKALPEFVFNSKRFTELVSAIGASLVALGCADELPPQGLFKNKTGFAPKADKAKLVVEKIRTEHLRDGTMENEILVLAILLSQGNLINDCFDKADAEHLKQRLKEVQNSDVWVMANEHYNVLMSGIEA